MYYIRLDSDDGHKLIYYCRKCGHEDTTITSENMCVSKEQIRRGEQRFSNMINEYTTQGEIIIKKYRCSIMG